MLRNLDSVIKYIPKIKQVYNTLKCFNPIYALNILEKKDNYINYNDLIDKACRGPMSYQGHFERFLQSGEGLSKPLIANIELTTKCNLKCVMCNRDGLYREIQDIDEKLFEKAVDDVAEIGCILQLNRFGEPTLSKNLEQKIRYAKNRGVQHVFFITNGTLLNEKLSERLIASGLNKILVSMDAATKQTFEQIRKGASYDIVSNNIKQFLKIKKQCNGTTQIGLNVTIQRDNMSEVLDIYRQWLGVVSEININFVNNYEGVHAFQDIINIKEERLPCAIILDRGIICEDGKVIMCCSGDINAVLQCGNISNSGLIDCYNSEVAKNIRQIHLNKEFDKLPVCNTCSYTYKSYHHTFLLRRLIERTAKEIVFTERIMGKAQVLS
ncbi:MAG: radical SAM protein [Candidatus Magnetoovum sp. WYHC-5]|nr:radical SAM protein [Candidatus Magnetoovum sp. WYHC-5]